MRTVPAYRLHWLLVLVGAVAALLMVVAYAGNLASRNLLFVDWLAYARAFERLIEGEPIYAAA